VDVCPICFSKHFKVFNPVKTCSEHVKVCVHPNQLVHEFKVEGVIRNLLHVLFRSAVDCSRTSQAACTRRNLCCWRLQLLHHHPGSGLTNTALRHAGHARPWWVYSSLWLAPCFLAKG
jgi:hypothetical protein